MVDLDLILCLLRHCTSLLRRLRMLRPPIAGSLAFIGDPSGDGLVLASMMRLRDEGSPLPAAAVVLAVDRSRPDRPISTAPKRRSGPEGPLNGVCTEYLGSSGTARTDACQIATELVLINGMLSR